MKIAMLGAALGAVVLAAPSHATTLSAAELLNQFNLITRGDVASTSHVEGRALIGGDLSGTFETGLNTRAADLPVSEFDALVVVGEQTGIAKGLNGGDVSIGTLSGIVDVSSGGTLTTGAINVPERFAETLDAFSISLADLEGGSPALYGQTLTFQADPLSDFTVFDMPFSALTAGVSSIDYDLAASDTIVINVSGTTGAFPNNNETKSLGRQVIWNFFEATSITLDRTVVGSILAPFAAVTVGTPYEGSLYADRVLMNSEGHLQPFSGVVPVAAVPLPASLPMISGALVLLGLARRRKAA
ncbi:MULTISPECIES: collagen-binding domain-containing protein [Actibacterium]|uniref:Choice-of-anchor A domain-containing protein n=1 Tax=Actibacterium naphthalenivorans TaxID=1614693 RepID=A0A840CHQ5_9RHOB|nr:MULTISPECIES: collagen-binding domain-containing protein [Actibacterium]ALG90377.1 hypothetical protein TQ29_09420 [Actibacterium sp. EMB200-NS6]MBB4022306.1 choice-of-anchor A domain-containing protein [Actibacterium naphthalenivorans]